EVAQGADELLPVPVPAELGVVLVLGEGGHYHHILGCLAGRRSCAPADPSQPASVREGRCVPPARRTVTPAEGSAPWAPGSPSSSVRTAVTRSGGQARATARTPSLL